MPRKLPPLKQLTHDRPRCQFCEKPLKPDTATVKLTGHLAEAPAEVSFTVEQGYDRKRIFR